MTDINQWLNNHMPRYVKPKQGTDKKTIWAFVSYSAEERVIEELSKLLEEYIGGNNIKTTFTPGDTVWVNYNMARKCKVIAVHVSIDLNGKVMEKFDLESDHVIYRKIPVCDVFATKKGVENNDNSKP